VPKYTHVFFKQNIAAKLWKHVENWPGGAFRPRFLGGAHLKTIELLVSDPYGIHARPAGVLVKRLQEFPCGITVEKGEKKADGKKLFALMKLAVKQGETIKLTADGEQEEEALAAAEAVFKEAGL
jgi:phosphocarrier protein